MIRTEVDAKCGCQDFIAFEDFIELRGFFPIQDQIPRKFARRDIR